MPRQTSREGTARVGYRIGQLRAELTRDHVEATLAQFGMSRFADEIMAFRIKTGALSQIAINGGPDRLKPYLNGSGYQRSLTAMQSTVASLCENVAPTDTQQPTIGDQQSAISTPELPTHLRPVAIIGALLAFLSGGAMFWKRRANRKLGREVANDRISCDIAATLSLGTENADIRIIELGQNGASVADTLSHSEGDQLTLVIGETRLESVVLWSNECFAGLKFNAAISKETRSDILNEHCSMARSQKKKRGSRKETASHSLTA